MAGYIDNFTVEQNASIVGFETAPLKTTVAATTLTLTASSNFLQIFSGSTAGQIVVLPNATTLQNGRSFRFINNATVSVVLENASLAVLYTLPARSLIECTLNSNATSAGDWIVKYFNTSTSVAGLNYGDASGFYYFDEYINADNYSVLEWIHSNGTGGSVSSDTVSESGRPGIFRQIISTSGGRASMYLGIFMLDDGIYTFEAGINVRTLATSGQDYSYRIGCMDTTTTTAAPANGIYFEYNRGTSANWRCMSTNSSTSTAVGSGSAVSEGTWVKLGWNLDVRSSLTRNWVRSSNVVTVTDVGHNIATGQVVVVSNSTGGTPVASGSYTVTGTATDTFTFAHTGSNSSGTLDYKYRICDFYINGTSVATIKTNFPENAVRPNSKAVKIAGATAVNFDQDYYILQGSLTTPR